MNKAWIAAPLAALAVAGCEKETGPDMGTGPAVPRVARSVAAAPSVATLASFAGMDSDGNGQVSSVEHARASQAMFRVMDADANGSVTVAEMDAASALVGGTAALSSEKKIAALDSDGDRQLTLAEYVGGSNTVFAQLDANDDDAIDRPEWDRGYAMLNPTSVPTPTSSAAAPAS